MPHDLLDLILKRVHRLRRGSHHRLRSWETEPVGDPGPFARGDLPSGAEARRPDDWSGHQARSVH